MATPAQFMLLTRGEDDMGVQTGTVNASVNGLLAWTADIAAAADNPQGPASAQIYLSKIMVPTTTIFTNLTVVVRQAGTNYTNGQVGLYDSNGTYLASSTVRATGGTDTFGALGAKTLALTAAQTIAGGSSVFVWAAVHLGTNAATVVTFSAHGQAITAAANAGLTVATSRCGLIAGHATNPLATIGNFSPAAITQQPVPFFVGVS
jgi:hypothetical protein